jgi:hypothetical protein
MDTGVHSAIGTLRGKVITLEKGVPALDGMRVRVIVEPEEEEKLDPEQQAKLWDAWVASGPQGPIEDDGEPEFP